jgi:copper chaperone CopZ
MKKMTFRVEGMHCSSCAMNLEGIEDDLPGILKVSASYPRETLQVEFDEARVNEAQISSAAQERGYRIIPA